ncbi:acyl carrier protein [Frisingicoccus sp.]|uniref:acyl carrier protein n=1 Tax=Frisingicoccus sp. TaxID=1918627 RepID=UPI003AB3B873
MELERLKEIIADIMGLDAGEITMDSSFAEDLGCDSLDTVEIVMAIEDELDIKIPDDSAESIVTVGDAMEAIKNILN